MKGEGTDVVDSVTIQYKYVGPCECPDNIDFCEWKFSTSTSHMSIITGLEEYSEYLFKIVASNLAGDSAPMEMNVTTSSSGKHVKIIKSAFVMQLNFLFNLAPDGVPESLNITAFNLTSITITWDEVKCINRNSNITGYMIKYNGTNAATSTHQFIASQLFPSTNYIFQIAAMSSHGIGPYSNITTASTSSPLSNVVL